MYNIKAPATIMYKILTQFAGADLYCSLIEQQMNRECFTLAEV